MRAGVWQVSRWVGSLTEEVGGVALDRDEARDAGDDAAALVPRHALPEEARVSLELRVHRFHLLRVRLGLPGLPVTARSGAADASRPRRGC